MWWDGSRRGIDRGVDNITAIDQRGVEFGVVALRRGQMDCGAEMIEGWILLRRWVGRACEWLGLVALR